MNSTVKRSITGVLLIAVMVGCLFAGKFFFGAMMAFILASMQHEFYRMTMGSEFPKSRIAAICAGLAVFSIVFLIEAYGVSPRYLVLAFIPFFFLVVNSLYVKDKDEFWMFSHLSAGLLYIVFPLSLTNLLVFRGGVFDGLLLLCFFIIIWSSDVGAFVFGMAFGQKYGRKLFPSVSPKKSWIGFWGGLATAVLSAVAMCFCGWLRMPLVHGIILSVIMNVTGVYGDLFESQWKRCYDLKDSGNMVPGHGGMLDRFDSALLAIPSGIIYLLLAGIL